MFAKAFGLWEHYEIVPSNFLLLGDYGSMSAVIFSLTIQVDRGPHSVETIAFLLAMKVVVPKKVLLRNFS